MTAPEPVSSIMSASVLSRLGALCCAILLSASVAAASPGPGRDAPRSAVVTTPQVRAELLAHAPDGIGPGKTVWLGLQLSHQPQWHTYWKNPGDSGLPTTLQWTLPAGLMAGDIAWPLPHKIPIGNLANYGYEGTVLLPVPLTLGADFKPPALAPFSEKPVCAPVLSGTQAVESSKLPNSRTSETVRPLESRRLAPAIAP